MITNSNIFTNVKYISNYNYYLDGTVRRYVHKKSIGYSLQYLEYLNNCLNENLHSVIQSQICKTFLITAVSIVELLAILELKKRNLHRDNISFQKIINKATQYKIFGEVVEGLYEKLHELRELRNRVHLIVEKIDHPQHYHDYNLFGKAQVNIANRALGNVLISKIFRPLKSDPRELFDYLIVKKIETGIIA